MATVCTKMTGDTLPSGQGATNRFPALGAAPWQG